MCWDRMNEIDIDHVVPCSYFDMRNPVEVKACWALVNLKPEWSSYNRAKGGRIVDSELTNELKKHLKNNGIILL